MQSYEELNAAEKYQQFFRHLPTHCQTVLDVGCNTGRGGKVLKKLNSHLKIVGLDCLQSRLKNIPKNIYSQTIYSYSTQIDIPDFFFNAVVAGEFIEHVYLQDILPTLQEFYRILKLGGRMLLTTPNPHNLHLKLTGRSVLGGTHVSQHTPETLQPELKKVGFSRIKIFGIGKVSRYLGAIFPCFAGYGSYLEIGNKI